jgi:phospholipase/carboxylesterase
VHSQRSHRNHSYTVVVLLGCAMTACHPTSSRAAEPPLEYIERLTGGARSDETLPMVVALHGMGDRPERAFETMYSAITDRTRVILPRAPIAWGTGWSWFAFTAGVRDDANTAHALTKASDRIDALVTRLVRQRRTSKVIVAGFSQGGMLTYTLALRHGERFRSAVAMAAFVVPGIVTREGCANAPSVRALHGSADTVVPLGWATETVERLHTHGCSVELTTFDGLGHSSSPVFLQTFTEAIHRAVTVR